MKLYYTAFLYKGIIYYTANPDTFAIREVIMNAEKIALYYLNTKTGVFKKIKDFNRDLEKYVTPISLTPEILEKAGFKMVEKKIETSDGVKALPGDFIKGKFVLTSGHHEFWYWGAPMDTRIDYVHQLQNLFFALTGEELIIEL